MRPSELRTRAVPFAAFAALAALAAFGCEKEGGGSDQSSGETSERALRLLGAASEDADVVVLLDLPGPLTGTVQNQSLFPMTDEQRQAMEEDLRAFLVERIGIDPLGAQAAVAFGQIGMPPRGAVLIQPVKGELKGGDKVVLEPRMGVVAKKKDDILALGTEDTIDEALERLGAGEPKGLAEWIADESSGAMLGAALDVGALKPFLQQAPIPDIERALVSVGAGGVRAVAIGEKEALEEIENQMTALADKAQTAVRTEREKATGESEPAAYGAAMILAEKHLENALAHARPKIEGGELTVAVPLRLKKGWPLLAASFGAGMAGWLAAARAPAPVPPATPVPSPGIAEPPVQTPSGSGDATQAFAELEELAEKMCACKDKACADGAYREFMAWAQKYRDLQAPDLQQQVAETATRLSTCMQKHQASAP